MSDKPGTKHDSKKDRWDLLPLPAVQAIVRVLTFGANKYTDDGWRMVPGARRRYLGALMRHLVEYALGQKKDPETGEHPLAHAGCCLLFLLMFDFGVEEVPEHDISGVISEEIPDNIHMGGSDERG